MTVFINVWVCMCVCLCVWVWWVDNWWTSNNELLLYTRQMERLTNTLLAVTHSHTDTDTHTHTHTHTHTNAGYCTLALCNTGFDCVRVVLMSSNSPVSFPSLFSPPLSSPLLPLLLSPLLTSPPSPVSSYQSLCFSLYEIIILPFSPPSCLLSSKIHPSLSLFSSSSISLSLFSDLLSAILILWYCFVSDVL